MRLVEATVAQEAMRRHAEMAAKARLQMARADPQLPGDFGNPDRLGDAGADQLAGALNMGRTRVGLLQGRFAAEQRTQQTDETMEKDFVIGGPQQFIARRLLVPDETEGALEVLPDGRGEIHLSPGVHAVCAYPARGVKLFQELAPRNLNEGSCISGGGLEEAIADACRDGGVAAVAHYLGPTLQIAHKELTSFRKEHGQERAGQGFYVKAARSASGSGKPNTAEVNIIATQTEIGCSAERRDLAGQSAAMPIEIRQQLVRISGLEVLGDPSRCRAGRGFALGQCCP